MEGLQMIDIKKASSTGSLINLTERKITHITEKNNSMLACENIKKKPVYVAHVCKNPSCNNIWIDIDLTNAKNRPPRWKYCEDCCKKLGITNPILPPKKELSENQKQTLSRNQFLKRKK